MVFAAGIYDDYCHGETSMDFNGAEQAQVSA